VEIKSFLDGINLFLDSLKGEQRSDMTIKAYRSDLELFGRFLRARSPRVRRINLRTVEGFVQYMGELDNCKSGSKGMSAGTVRRRLATLASYFDYRARQSNGKIENPVRLIRRPRRQLRSPQPVDDGALQSC
jgi:site-specific recombinase XerD